MNLPYFDNMAIQTATPYPALIAAIAEAFRHGGVAPARHVHTVPKADENDSVLLLMPSWNDTGNFGVKLATINAENATRDLPTINGIYVLFDSQTSTPVATFDAATLTARRTAAASAFAASRLARADASSMLMVGTGHLSRPLIEAHAAVRDLQKIRVWGRTPDKAAEVADWARSNITDDAEPVTNLAAACSDADIISAATLSREPLVRGANLKPGCHVDLVGAYEATMRESDSLLFERADQVFVDTFEGAREEAGDLLQAIDEGALSMDSVSGDLYKLAASADAVRHSDDGITVFKSVGTGLEDLAAAVLCYCSISPNAFQTSTSP
ncbi:MAG: ornithine cyclodeaminase family protein [Gammaproteobacteria bacterium]|nr:ornithine cyclodeaminase family protein [Gammaproteobacteria bacterium]